MFCRHAPRRIASAKKAASYSDGKHPRQALFVHVLKPPLQRIHAGIVHQRSHHIKDAVDGFEQAHDIGVDTDVGSNRQRRAASLLNIADNSARRVAVAQIVNANCVTPLPSQPRSRRTDATPGAGNDHDLFHISESLIIQSERKPGAPAYDLPKLLQKASHSLNPVVAPGIDDRHMRHA